MSAPLAYELRFWPEFARLLAEVRFWTPEHGEPRRPVLLIPGFLAGDASLTVLAGWLRRRGHEVRHSGIRLNVGCAGRELDRLGTVLEAFDEPAVVIGQSRGGTLARALAARHPDEIAAMMTLGSPVLDQLAVSPSVLRTVRSVALLGDLGVRGLLTNECRDGACCSEFRALLAQPLGPEPPWVAIYSRSDAIVDWRACLDPAADCVEVDGSHCGMAVNVHVYRELERLLERSRGDHVQSMSVQDATFLHVENDVTPMHIGGVSIFEGPPPSFEELSEMVRAKLHYTPRYRQKVRFVPLGVSEPMWVDDPYFEVDYHLRHTAVPAPGSGEQLRTMAARVFSQHLDRARPLWEIWMVEGLEHGRWALLSKVHHCMVDGVAATDLMSVMFGDDAEPAPAADTWRPGPEPSDVELFVRGAYHRARHPAEQASAAVRARSELLRGTVRLMRAVAAAAPAMRPSASSLTGPIGPHRVWSWAHVQLGDVKQVRSALGGTVNDVVLTIVTNGFRDLLLARGEHVGPRRTVRTMVPVSVRLPGERGVYNNRVSAVFARLPVGIEDPAERLAVIRAEMDEIKSSGQAVAGDVLAQLSGFAPPLLLALGSRAMTRSARLNMDTATTNVPGPQRPIHALGRRLLESYPYVPIVGTIRIVVAIFSYDGGLYFGVTGDRDHAADLDVLTSGIETGLADLLEGAAALPA